MNIRHPGSQWVAVQPPASAGPVLLPAATSRLVSLPIPPSFEGNIIFDHLESFGLSGSVDIYGSETMRKAASNSVGWGSVRSKQG